eukprot:GHVP01004424.1.p1 GENE.GHVP01004424.1~~GHVP01004424.1.p1  ORF type:complete len:195 (-),score=35.68 GHVP01004424.1:62-646(-)
MPSKTKQLLGVVFHCTATNVAPFSEAVGEHFLHLQEELEVNHLVSLRNEEGTKIIKQVKYSLAPLLSNGPQFFGTFASASIMSAVLLCLFLNKDPKEVGITGICIQMLVGYASALDGFRFLIEPNRVPDGWCRDDWEEYKETVSEVSPEGITSYINAEKGKLLASLATVLLGVSWYHFKKYSSEKEEEDSTGNE